MGSAFGWCLAPKLVLCDCRYCRGDDVPGADCRQQGLFDTGPELTSSPGTSMTLDYSPRPNRVALGNRCSRCFRNSKSTGVDRPVSLSGPPGFRQPGFGWTPRLLPSPNGGARRRSPGSEAQGV